MCRQRILRYSSARPGTSSLEVSSQELVLSEIGLLAFMATGYLRDAVCHAGDWDGVRPWPRPLSAGRDPDEAGKYCFRC